MKRKLLLIVVLLWLCGPVPGYAQIETGAICVTTFADADGSGQRDEGETVLVGVNVNLSTGSVIIATHIIEAGETQYCFENLLTGIYTITFSDSPLYRATTASEGTFAVDGQRLTVNAFGAVPVLPENLRAEVASQNTKPDERLDTSTRLILATGGSMLVMLFMVGMGAVMLGLLSSRRSRRASKRKTQVMPPATIEPPGH